MTDRDRATRLLTIRVLKDLIAAEEKQLREAAADALVVGERVSGLLDPADPDSLLGFVQLTKGRETWTVTDPAALLAWVERCAPGEVVTTRAARPSFVTAILADCKSHGGWISPDGELLTPDGVECRQGSPTLTVKPTAEADGLIREALASHRLSLPGGGS